MRVFPLAISTLLVPLYAASALATTAFEDNKLNLRNCDGVDVTVRWNGNDFSLAVFGKSDGRAHASFKFLGWNGSCQTASWDSDQAKFVIDEAGSAMPSLVVRFVAQDGAKWIGMRESDGFFVTRVAAEAEEISNARLSEIASWLERTSEAFTPGAKLAKHLAVVAAD